MVGAFFGAFYDNFGNIIKSISIAPVSTGLAGRHGAVTKSISTAIVSTGPDCRFGTVIKSISTAPVSTGPAGRPGETKKVHIYEISRAR